VPPSACWHRGSGYCEDVHARRGSETSLTALINSNCSLALHCQTASVADSVKHGWPAMGGPAYNARQPLPGCLPMWHAMSS